MYQPSLSFPACTAKELKAWVRIVSTYSPNHRISPNHILLRLIYPHTHCLHGKHILYTIPGPSTSLISFYLKHFQPLDPTCPHTFSSNLIYPQQTITNEVHMSRFHHGNINNRKDRASIFTLKPTSPVEVLAIRIT